MKLALVCALAACASAPRPYDVHVPPHYDAARPTALVIVLHGYADDGGKQIDDYFHLSEVADRETFLVARPDATKDSAGHRFWNATDACCDFAGTHVDDVAALAAMLDDIERRYHVDPARVYVVGHSNGGFMAHRLACELAPRIAAIAVLAGAQWLDAARCRPAAKVSVVAIHGDADSIVHYGGGALDEVALRDFEQVTGLRLPSPRAPGPRAYPSAHQTVATWAALDGCRGAPAMIRTFELAGLHADVEAYAGCPGVAVELWTLHGGDHMPDLAKPPSFADAVWTFLAAHPRR